MPDTTVYPQSETRKKRRHDRGWRAVLFNDDVTPFDLVILAIQKAAGLSLEVAEMIAMEAHSSGSAVVKRGLPRDSAESICGVLRRETRLEGQLPGVRCEAQKE